ncbi:site-specific recombinase XerD [Geomicrobium sp. JCM 19037]|uniref:tyrosine-type recombinase/integrase n=1 Tax=Geomicrobium sp. JCM 19037 TaxID=1460634 RepID=UPI00045F167D|nr:tyrosine-type recombinase/integrase [Geomicrobium sp. JCM 19037]GAK02299.1 site-specific recombinase XerD [Geomicrobium sp. JCM 19037]
MDKQFTFLSRKDNAITRFDIEEKTEEFLEVKRKLGRSPKTLRTYRQSLEQFSKWYKEVGEPTLTQPVIIDYIDYLRNKDRWDEHPTSPTKKGGVTGRSLNNALRNLSSFFGYFTSIGEIRVNIVKGIGKFSQESDTFSIFTDEDVKALISAPVQRTYTGFRDYCMMLVLIDAGPRSTELTQINVSDFESKVGQITLRAETTKDKKSRILPLSRFTVRNLNKLVAFTNTDGDDPLFLTQFGERCHRDTFAKNLHNYGRRVGVKTRVSHRTPSATILPLST